MGKRNHYRHHAFLISLRNMFLGKASHCRDHSSGVGGWKTGAVIGTTPLRSVYGQRKPIKGPFLWGVFVENKAIIDITPLRSLDGKKEPV